MCVCRRSLAPYAFVLHSSGSEGKGMSIKNRECHERRVFVIYARGAAATHTVAFGFCSSALFFAWLFVSGCAWWFWPRVWAQD